MKRILSLALVLVMILSVMPMASAAGGLGQHNTNPNDEHWKSTSPNYMPQEKSTTHPAYVAPTCTKGGTEVWICTKEGCDFYRIEEVGPTNEHTVGTAATCKAPAVCAVCEQPYGEADSNAHAYPETWTYPENFDCTVGGTKTRKCALDETHPEDTATVAPLSAHVPGSDGKCTNPGCTKTAVTYTLNVPDTTLEVRKGNKISIGASVTRTPADSGATLPTISYSGGESSIATIDSATGQITGVGVGTTSFTVSAEGCESVTVSVTVYNSGVIGGIENTSTAGSSVTLTPTLTVNGSSVSNVTFSFKSGSTVLGTGSSVEVTGSNEIKSITVSVVKYTIGTTEYQNTGDYAIADKTVKVSFYHMEDASATVKSGVSSFMFSDTGVFSRAVIDDVTMSLPENITMQNLFSYSGNADLNTYQVVFYPDSSVSSVATITFTGLYGDFDTGAAYSFYNTQNLKFTVLSEGTYEYDYQLVSTDGLIIQAGEVTINTQEGEADIKYTTNYTKAITIDENDFEDLWDASKLSGDLDYVTFQVDNSTPWYGYLYSTANSATRKSVTNAMKFYFEASASDTYDLDAVTFVPHSTKTSPYTEIIPFTCYGTTGNKTLNGTMEIKVGEEMKFTDVKKTDYFYDAVVWAVGEGITSGTSSTTFSPNATCTRAQVVTFLWRAAGAEKMSGTVPFTDVKTSDYYYDAVVWAYKNNVTTGLTATTFGPNATVTRGQVVTFLHRAKDLAYGGSYNPFTDVKATDYYYDAVLWAVKNDVTTGLTATSFGPNSGCTRGQIVTFLYRAYEG